MSTQRATRAQAHAGSASTPEPRRKEILVGGAVRRAILGAPHRLEWAKVQAYVDRFLPMGAMPAVGIEDVWARATLTRVSLLRSVRTSLTSPLNGSVQSDGAHPQDSRA